MFLNAPPVRRIEVYNETNTASDALHEAKLDNVTKRPNGKYPYVVGIEIYTSFIATETITAGGIDCEAKDCWQGAIKQIHMDYRKINRFKNYSGLSVVRRIDQMDHIYKPDVIASMIRTTKIATTAGDTTVTQKFLVHLDHKWFQNKKGKLDCAAPLGAFVDHGGFSFQAGPQIIAGAAGADRWEKKTDQMDVKITLLVVDLDNPKATVWVEESEGPKTAETWVKACGPKDRNRRLTGALACDDADAAFTMPSSFNWEIDNKTPFIKEDGDDWVDNENEKGGRHSAINALCPAALPLVTTVDREDSDQLVIEENCTWNDLNDAHAGQYKVVHRVQFRPTPTEMQLLLEDQEVPPGDISKFIAEAYGDDADPDTARVLDGGKPIAITRHYKSDKDMAGIDPAMIRAVARDTNR